jgi:hypothetical protein
MCRFVATSVDPDITLENAEISTRPSLLAQCAGLRLLAAAAALVVTAYDISAPSLLRLSDSSASISCR